RQSFLRDDHLEERLQNGTRSSDRGGRVCLYILQGPVKLLLDLVEIPSTDEIVKGTTWGGERGTEDGAARTVGEPLPSSRSGNVCSNPLDVPLVPAWKVPVHQVLERTTQDSNLVAPRIFIRVPQPSLDLDSFGALGGNPRSARPGEDVVDLIVAVE